MSSFGTQLQNPLAAYPLEEELSLEIKGRDLVSGLPKAITVTSQEIRDALKEPLDAIIETVKVSLERTPPELAADLIDHGITMAGGGAQLKGLDRLISEATGLPVHITDEPLTAVVLGTGKVLSEIRYLKRVTVPIKSEMLP